MEKRENTKYNNRCLRLRLIVKAENPEEKKAIWSRLRQIMDDNWKAANSIASGQYLNDQFMRRVYARKKIDSKDLVAVNDVENSFEAFFGVRRQATTERDIRIQFPDLPPCITNPLNQVVFSSYKAEKKDMLLGNRSLRSYKKEMPATTTRASMSFSSENNEHVVSWKLSRTEQIKFSILYGRDKANFRLAVQRILDQINDYGAPQIQLKDKDLYLLLPIKEPVKPNDLNPELSVGVDLGIAIPAYAALSEGLQRLSIGSRDDFQKVRLQMQSRARRLHRALTMVHSGHGRKRKCKAMDDLKEKELNFARSYNHFISKRIIDFAIKNRAGTIKLELLEGIRSEEQQKFILRNWSYFQLQSMIESKSNREGIKVQYIDPYLTSQTCSQCGNYEDGQREVQETFLCKKCGNKMNADYNAALNIAKSTKIVNKKEDCEIFKKISAGPTAEG